MIKLQNIRYKKKFDGLYFSIAITVKVNITAVVIYI